MDRRQFLIRLGLLAGEPLLKSFFDRALAFVENHDEPLLEVPREVRHELFVKKADYGYEWCLGRPETSIPEPPTWEEFFRSTSVDLETDMVDRELEPQQLRETMNPEEWGSYWSIEESSNAKAFEYLSRLDLGPAFDPNAKSDVAGEIQFLDCPGICCHYRGVETYDLVSISLLQNRLNELGEPTRVAMLEP